MKWRILPLESHDPYTNMAIDDALTELVGQGKSPPTIRFYRWKGHGVSLGRSQKVENINLESCIRQGVGVVRRRTGGFAVFHDYNDITYSVIAPRTLFSEKALDIYRKICSWMLDALHELGIDAYIHENIDIRVGQGKISGNAQAWINRSVLQHGTLIYRFDLSKTMDLLNLDDEALVDAEVTSVLDHIDVPYEKVYGAVRRHFLKGKEYVEAPLTVEEQALVGKLLEEKYRTDEWNLKRESPGREGPCYVRLEKS